MAIFIGNTMVECVQALMKEFEKRIENMMFLKGTPSKFDSEYSLIIQGDKFMFNLDVGHPSDSYAVEIRKEGIISNYGHTYGLDTLPLEELAQIIDHIDESEYTYRVGCVNDNDTGETEYLKYFRKKEDAKKYFRELKHKVIALETPYEDIVLEGFTSTRRGFAYQTLDEYGRNEIER
jgi:PHP family Zn ribbon phosphoesterase